MCVDKAHAQDVKQALASGQDSAYVSKQGNPAKVVVFPGDSTILEGEKINFATRASAGELPATFAPEWSLISPPNKDAKPAATDAERDKTKNAPEQPAITSTGTDSKTTQPIEASAALPLAAASIDKDGHAVFRKPGEYHVLAKIPGIAKDESFGPISGLGKVSQGLAMLQPKNWDSLVLVILFGATMFLSQKVMAVAPKPSANGELDEQQIIQQQTAQMMPLIVTGTFMFIPMPTGVLLYFVLANVIQTLQSWLIMKMPSPAFIDATDGDDGGPPPGSNPQKTLKVIETNGDKSEKDDNDAAKSKLKSNKKTLQSNTKGGAKTMSGKGKLRKKKI